MPDTSSPNLAHHIISVSYDFNTFLLTSFTDHNGKQTTYQYIDIMFRLKQANFPDGGQTNFTYNDTSSFNSPYVERRDKIDSSGNQTDFFIQFDGVGRPLRTARFNDENGT